MNELQTIAANADLDTLQQVTSFGYAIHSSSETSVTQSLPDFPCDNLKLVARIIEANPSVSAFKLIHRLYPFDIFLPRDCHSSLITLFNALDIPLPTYNNSNKNSSFWNWNKSDSRKQKVSSVNHSTLSQMHLESNKNVPYHEGMIMNKSFFYSLFVSFPFSLQFIVFFSF